MADLTFGIIGTATAIFSMYDTCRRAYEGCKDMHLCGKNAVELFQRLEGQYTLFTLVMATKRRNLEDPDCLDDKHHVVTKGINSELSIINTQFRKCSELVQRYLASSIGSGDPRAEPDEQLEILLSRTMFGTSDGKAIRRRDPKILETHKNISFLHKIEWMFRDKDAFSDSITVIERAVEALERIIKLRAARRPSTLLTSADQVRRNLQLEQRKVVKLALQRLQRALAKANRNSARVWTIDLSIAHDPQADWTTTSDDYPDMPLRPEGLLFTVQRRSDNSSDHSSLLKIELHPDPRYSDPDATNVPQLSKLDDPDTVFLEVGEDEFGFWGELSDPRDLSRKDRHRVFADKAPYRPRGSLRNVIETELSRSTSAPLHLATLALSILRWHLYILGIRGNNQNSKIEDYVFYESSLGPAADRSRPFFLEPYLSCGIARPPQSRAERLSRPADPVPDPNAAIIELGLILYQIGSSKLLDYTSSDGNGLGESLNNARLEALQNLGSVDRNVGTTYGSVVEVCLLGNAEDEEEAVSSSLVRLTRYQEELRQMGHSGESLSATLSASNVAGTSAADPVVESSRGPTTRGSTQTGQASQSGGLFSRPVNDQGAASAARSPAGLEDYIRIEKQTVVARA